jgi:hypothetical protein
VFLTYRYRLLPLKSQHRALERLCARMRVRPAALVIDRDHNASLNILRAGIGAGALNVIGWR